MTEIPSFGLCAACGEPGKYVMVCGMRRIDCWSGFLCAKHSQAFRNFELSAEQLHERPRSSVGLERLFPKE